MKVDETPKMINATFEEKKMVNYINEYSELAQKEYKNRYNRVGTQI